VLERSFVRNGREGRPVREGPQGEEEEESKVEVSWYTLSIKENSVNQKRGFFQRNEKKERGIKREKR